MNEKRQEKIPLVIENEYSDFGEFVEKEKRSICLKIIESFEDVLNTKSNGKKLFIVATVEGITFNTEFDISQNNIELLTKTVNTYFEQNEEYEECGRIQKLSAQLN